MNHLKSICLDVRCNNYQNSSYQTHQRIAYVSHHEISMFIAYSRHRFSQKWQLRVCKLNFRVCKMPLLLNEKPHENERIWVILGCAIGLLIACAKHRCTGGWLKLWQPLNCLLELIANSNFIGSGCILEDQDIITHRAATHTGEWRTRLQVNSLAPGRLQFNFS